MPLPRCALALAANESGQTSNPGSALATVMSLANSDDVALVREAQAGNRAAFEELVHRYDRDVLRLALNLMKRTEDARDVYQEAFLKVYQNLQRFRFECSFYTWLYRIVANCSVDHIRVRQSRRDQSRAESLDEASDIASNAAPGPERLARSAEIERHVASALSHSLVASASIPA